MSASQFTDKVEQYANKWHVSSSLLSGISMCESSASSTIRSLGILKNGKQEDSIGVMQINLDAHPEITYDQAIDVDFSLNWGARQISLGNAPWQWVTCYRRVTSVQVAIKK